jgi:hypothetical protein
MEKSIGLDEDTYDNLERLANKNHRTLIGQIRHMIEVSK